MASWSGRSPVAKCGMWKRSGLIYKMRNLAWVAVFRSSKNSLPAPLSPTTCIPILLACKNCQKKPFWKSLLSSPCLLLQRCALQPVEAVYKHPLAMDAAMTSRGTSLSGSVQNRDNVDTFWRICNRCWCIMRPIFQSTKQKKLTLSLHLPSPSLSIFCWPKHTRDH